jgi:hypothetical protein
VRWSKRDLQGRVPRASGMASQRRLSLALPIGSGYPAYFLWPPSYGGEEFFQHRLVFDRLEELEVRVLDCSRLIRSFGHLENLAAVQSQVRFNAASQSGLSSRSPTSSHR